MINIFKIIPFLTEHSISLLKLYKTEDDIFPFFVAQEKVLFSPFLPEYLLHVICVVTPRGSSSLCTCIDCPHV